jgi:hypothetical protein
LRTGVQALEEVSGVHSKHLRGDVEAACRGPFGALSYFVGLLISHADQLCHPSLDETGHDASRPDMSIEILRSWSRLGARPIDRFLASLLHSPASPALVPDGPGFLCQRDFPAASCAHHAPAKVDTIRPTSIPPNRCNFNGIWVNFLSLSIPTLDVDAGSVRLLRADAEQVGPRARPTTPVTSPNAATKPCGSCCARRRTRCSPGSADGAG